MSTPGANAPAQTGPVNDIPARSHIAWGIVLVPAVAQFLLHIFTNGRFGIFRDEYYYLACAARPAFGYVDQPPFSIWLLSAWKSVFGDSVHSIRILPALCGSGLIVLAAAIAAELGGRRWAQLFAGLAAMIGAAGLVIGGFYSMNCFDLLAWSGAYLLVIRIARTGQARWWVPLGLVLGVGLLNKVGVIVLGAALVVGLLATRNRKHFRDGRLWLAGAIALLFLLPYAVWNAAHGWPTLEFIRNAQQYKISAMSPPEFLKENILEANPVTLLLWLPGLIWLAFARRAGRFRIVPIMFVVTFVILILQKSKPYYMAASYPVLMAAGAVAWEGWTGRRMWSWARYAVTLILVGGLALFGPMALPVLTPERTLAYMQRLGIAPAAAEVGHTSPLPQYFSDRFGWEELARVVSEVYTTLPAGQRKRCVAFGTNYGKAGALEYWSRRYELPPVVSGHNNYWLWGIPEGTQTIIVVGSDEASLAEVFDAVTFAAESTAAHALEARIPVWVCRSPKRPLAELWPDLKLYI